MRGKLYVISFLTNSPPDVQLFLNVCEQGLRAIYGMGVYEFKTCTKHVHSGLPSPPPHGLSVKVSNAALSAAVCACLQDLFLTYNFLPNQPQLMLFVLMLGCH